MRIKPTNVDSEPLRDQWRPAMRQRAQRVMRQLPFTQTENAPSALFLPAGASLSPASSSLGHWWFGSGVATWQPVGGMGSPDTGHAPLLDNGLQALMPECLNHVVLYRVALRDVRYPATTRRKPGPATYCLRS